MKLIGYILIAMATIDIIGAIKPMLEIASLAGYNPVYLLRKDVWGVLFQLIGNILVIIYVSNQLGLV